MEASLVQAGVDSEVWVDVEGVDMALEQVPERVPEQAGASAAALNLQEELHTLLSR